MADQTVVAIAPNAVVHAVSPAPRFEVADEAALHFEDTSPLPISAPGMPPTVAIELAADFSSAYGMAAWC